MASYLKKIGNYFFSKEKVFPYLRIYRLFGVPFVVDRRNKVKKGPIQNNKVVFWASSNHFTCNPKYIALALLSLSKDIDIVWVAPSEAVNKGEFPKRVRLITDLTEAVREISTAKVFVANERTICWLRQGVEKREGQLFIQTWHGSLGIKKTGADRSDLSEEVLSQIEFDSNLLDLILSNGGYSTNLYSRLFCNKGVIAEVGLPRNDLFYRETESKFKASFNIDSKTKVVLYAPTWRNGKSIEAFDAAAVVKALKCRFGGAWQLVYRLHHLQKNAMNMDGINVSDYPDIQEIMAEVDVVITDYSSCIYDFVLTKRPGFIFATDRAEYDNTRGLYYRLEETPYPVSESQDGLIENILSFDEGFYSQRVTEFLKGKGCREDGNASEKVAKFIFDFLKNGKQNFELLTKARKFF